MGRQRARSWRIAGGGIVEKRLPSWMSVRRRNPTARDHGSTPRNWLPSLKLMLPEFMLLPPKLMLLPWLWLPKLKLLPRRQLLRRRRRRQRARSWRIAGGDIVEKRSSSSRPHGSMPRNWLPRLKLMLPEFMLLPGLWLPKLKLLPRRQLLPQRRRRLQQHLSLPSRAEDKSQDLLK